MGMMQHVRLLAADEPAPFTVEHADGASDFLIVCDHASRRIPRQLGKLGLTDDDLLRHIAWDIGAAAVARIVRELDQRQQEGRRTIVVTMHSFTPVFLDQTRSLHAGVLYNHDTRFAHHVLAQLREDPELLVGDNAPYRASEATDYALVVHGEKRGLACVELEVRQDLIEHERGQQQWADRLTNVLERARLALFPA